MRKSVSGLARKRCSNLLNAEHVPEKLHDFSDTNMFHSLILNVFLSIGRFYPIERKTL